MKQKIILIFILASHFCSAQKFQAKWGAELKKSEIGDIDKSLGIINDGVFFTTSRFNTVKLRKFSTFNMSQLYQKPIFGDEGGTPDLKRHEYNKGEIFSTKEGFILFSTFYNKNDEHICYANKLDFNGNYVAKPIQLDIINAKSKRKKGVFNFVFSNDSTKFAIVADPGFEKYSDEKYKISLYDAKCNFLKAVEITLPYKDKNFTLQNFDVTNEGDVYMLARIDRDKKELKNLKDEETEYYFQLIKISPLKNGQIKQFDIKLPEKYIESISFITDKFSNIQCLGFYNDMVRRRKANNGINGFFYFKVNNETGQLQNTQTKEFSAQLVEQLENKRRAQKERGLNSSFELKFFLDREDGGLIVVAEEDFIQTQTYCTQNGCRTVYYYHNNEILIINIEPGGQISNITPIVKYQTTMNDYGVMNSIFAKYVNGKTYIVFNDHPENINKRNPKDIKVANPYGGKVTAVVVAIDNNGNYTKSNMFLAEDKKYTIVPKKFRNLNKSEIVLVSNKKPLYLCCITIGSNLMKFGKMSFE